MRALRTHIEFLHAAETAPAKNELTRVLAPNPNDIEARYRLASASVVDNDHETALDQLLAILRADRQYRDGVALRGLLTIFELLGDDHALVAEFRRRTRDFSLD